MNVTRPYLSYKTIKKHSVSNKINFSLPLNNLTRSLYFSYAISNNNDKGIVI
jgi:hypothetical protein